MTQLEKTLSFLTLCTMAALTSGCGVDDYRIVSSDTVPSVDLTDGSAVCADGGINSIAANEIEFWLHSSADAGLDRRITAALTVSIKSSSASSHVGTTTTCETTGAGIAFVRTDGSINGPAQFTAHFTVTPSREGSPQVVVDHASLLAAAHELIELQAAELDKGKLSRR